MSLSRDVKQEILDRILSADNLEGRSDLVSFLNRVWPLAQMPSTDQRFKDAAGDVWQHMVNNSDWTVEEMLVSRLRLLDSDDSVFFQFLQAYVHPRVRRDEYEQEAAVAGINRVLMPRGYELATQDAAPPKIFRVQPASGSSLPAPSGYEVVLSFAGEQRAYVEQVAQSLVAAGVRIFYDNYEVA
jgi:hypothetical protein